MWNKEALLLTGGAFITSLLISWVLMPVVIRFANKRQLFDIPDGRKLHADNISRIGGVAIMVSVILGISIFIKPQEMPSFSYLIAGMVIMFFVGLVDDMFPIKPVQKLLGEIIPSALVVFLAGERIEQLNGLLGIYSLPDYVAILLSFIIILLVINSFNLIDGINGLAGICGLIAAFCFGILSLYYQDINLAVIAFSLAGGIVAFLRFNLVKPKIFMGDSGSLLIGFLSAFLMLSVAGLTENSFATEDVLPAFSNLNERLFILILCIVVVPITDLIRVFIIRVVKGHSPFSPDRNHIHHILLELGFSHFTASLILGASTILILLIFFLTLSFEINTQFVLIITIVALLSSLPWLMLNWKKSTQSNGITL
jgi:UDP-GlcNAc:undecaprenyl-phosphate GlcNAc-1-phosphate transferase